MGESHEINYHVTLKSLQQFLLHCNDCITYNKSSNQPINRQAYVGATLVPIAVPICCCQSWSLNSKILPSRTVVSRSIRGKLFYHWLFSFVKLVQNQTELTVLMELLESFRVKFSL